MRVFDYQYLKELELKNDIVQMLCRIEKHKSEMFFFEKEYPVLVDNMQDICKIDSILSSLALDGIYTSDKDIIQIKEKRIIKNEIDKEILGCIDAYDYVFENNELDPNNILSLHEKLFSYTNKPKGEYKKVDNALIEMQKNGEKKILLVPISYKEIDLAILYLLRAYNEAFSKNEIHPLILCACCLLDYICIMPFKEGNGRMSRLFANELLLKSGYEVNKYISIDDIIYSTYSLYNNATRECFENWNENQNEYIPFIKYFLSVVDIAYSKICERYKLTGYTKLSKADRIRLTILNSNVEYSKDDIYRMWPDMVYNTIELELSKMIKEGLIKKIGSTKDAKYIKV